ncbi:baculoviral IAP repeat-containing protein [Endozoicomonas sp.]|uniref:baculoviral IAP repeat-containing protein n=1 Tax=Endozoicomonas sp. TaxID=1892382 RepID=UPI00383A1B03
MNQYGNYNREYDTTYMCGPAPQGRLQDSVQYGTKTYINGRLYICYPQNETEPQLNRPQPGFPFLPQCFNAQQLATRDPQRAPVHSYNQQSHVDTPQHPQFQSEFSRISTFWGHEHKFPHHTPQALAEAGFFRKKHASDDKVSCYYCNITLQNWEPADVPWVEHASWVKINKRQCKLVSDKLADIVRPEQNSGNEAAASFETEKQSGQYDDQHTDIKNNPSLIIDNFKKQEPDGYQKLENMYAQREGGMVRVDSAIVHWHYTENKSGKNHPRATSIIGLLNQQNALNGSKVTRAVEQSCSIHKKHCQTFDDGKLALKLDSEQQQIDNDEKLARRLQKLGI